MIKQSETVGLQRRKVLKLTKDNNLYRVHFNNDTSYLCSEDDILAYNLYIGNSIKDDVINLLYENDSYYMCLNDAIIIINYKAYAIKQVKERLIKKQHQLDDINAVVDKLLSNGLLNDQEFSVSYAYSKLMQGYGPNYIKNKLANLDIKYENETTYEELYDILLKHFIRNNNGTYNQDVFRSKFFTKMQAKGFSFDLIRDLLDNEAILENNDIIYQDYEKAYNKYCKKHQGYALKTKIKTSLFKLGYTLDEIDKIMEELINE